MEASKLQTSHSKMSGNKYKRIMSHVSKFLHGTKTSAHSTKRRDKNKTEESMRTKTEMQVEIEERCSALPPKEEELDFDPAYSTIKEVTAVVHESVQSADSSTKTPPPNPNNIEDLYAKVKKKPKRKSGRSVPNPPSENVPSVSVLPNDETGHQPVINYNVIENTLVKEIQETALQHDENGHNPETNVDELQTWKLLNHQLQKTKQPSQMKLSHTRKYVDSYRAENRSQKQITPVKKHILSNERFYQHSHLNFPTTTEKSAQCTRYRSLEDFSALAHKEDNVNKIWQECQEEIMKFQHNMEQVVEENRVLHQEIHSLLQKEAKWKEEKENMLVHKQDNHLLTQKNNILMQELSAVHEQKEKEVKHLSYQVQRLQAEKNNLLEKLHSALHEKETLEFKYSRMCERNSETVSYEVHVQAIQENQRLLNDIRKKHQEDLDRILQSCQDVENEKNNLSIQVQILQDDVKGLNQNNVSLKNSVEEALKAKAVTLSQLEQSKQQNLEMQDLLMSLLKLAEEATTERDIALTKAEFQEKQQTQIQGTVVEHSIGIGRLQEHIVNIRRRVNEEIRNVEMSFR